MAATSWCQNYSNGASGLFFFWRWKAREMLENAWRIIRFTALDGGRGLLIKKVNFQFSCFFDSGFCDHFFIPLSHTSTHPQIHTQSPGSPGCWRTKVSILTIFGWREVKGWKVGPRVPRYICHRFAIETRVWRPG